LVQIFYRWRPILPDADDDRILEVAVRSGSNIVTFNRIDFQDAEAFGVQIITPKVSDGFLNRRILVEFAPEL